jgi:hypothetical protein
MKMSGELVALKNDSVYVKEIESLEPMLDAAFAETTLPAQVPDKTRARVEDLLWRCRTANPE